MDGVRKNNNWKMEETNAICKIEMQQPNLIKHDANDGNKSNKNDAKNVEHLESEDNASMYSSGLFHVFPMTFYCLLFSILFVFFFCCYFSTFLISFLVCGVFTQSLLNWSEWNTQI